MAGPSFRFDIEPLHQFAKVNAAVRRPREITSFSYDEEHAFRADDSSLRYYYPPTLPVNLSAGFDTFRQLDDTNDDHLDGLLQAMILYEQSTGKRTDVDFMTWRGMMTKILTSPFSLLDSWEMNATLFQSTIFIEENHEKKLSSRSNQYGGAPAPGNMSQDLMSYWGYKFETISLLDQHWCYTSREQVEGRENEVVSNYAQYCSIVRTGFNKMKMVIAGEVDAVLDYKPEDKSAPVNWVELKTTAELNGPKDQVKLERKLLKFWAQSFLLGVPKIVVGFRSQQGVLQRIEEMDTQTIPDKVQAQGKRLWHGQTCIDFTASFLEWLKATITSEGVWRIRKQERGPFLEVFKVEETGSGDILSQEFVDWRLNKLPTLNQQQGVSQNNGTGVPQDSDAGGHSNTAQPAVSKNGHSGVTMPEATPSAQEQDLLDDRKVELLRSLQQNLVSDPP